MSACSQCMLVLDLVRSSASLWSYWTMKISAYTRQLTDLPAATWRRPHITYSISDDASIMHADSLLLACWTLVLSEAAWDLLGMEVCDSS
jgi:hypothetical protein